jgi:hypothetical protein
MIVKLLKSQSQHCKPKALRQITNKAYENNRTKILLNIKRLDRSMSFLVVLLLITTGCTSIVPHPRPWTKQEKQAAMFFLAAHTANAYTTELHQDQRSLYYESNPILGKHPSDSETNAYFSVTGLGTLLIAHLYPELRERIFWNYFNVNTSLALHDYRMMRQD